MGTIEGVVLTPLKEIAHEKGNIFHALKASESTFVTFGEAYFSEVNPGVTKGWKMHTCMVLNLIVPVGVIRFVLYDFRMESSTKGVFMEAVLGHTNYQRITIPSGIFVAFQGMDTPRNMLLNIASIEHQPDEAVNVSLDEISYQW